MKFKTGDRVEIDNSRIQKPHFCDAANEFLASRKIFIISNFHPTIQLEGQDSSLYGFKNSRFKLVKRKPVTLKMLSKACNEHQKVL